MFFFGSSHLGIAEFGMDQLPVTELLKRIRELEAAQLRIQQAISKGKHCGKGKGGHVLLPQLPSPFEAAPSPQLPSPPPKEDVWRPNRPLNKFDDKFYVNLLDSLGQAVHVLDHDCNIIWW